MTAPTCVNCDQDAAYLVNDPGVNPLHFCTLCLPTHLRAATAQGQYALPKPPPSKKAPAE